MLMMIIIMIHKMFIMYKICFFSLLRNYYCNRARKSPAKIIKTYAWPSGICRHLYVASSKH